MGRAILSAAASVLALAQAARPALAVGLEGDAAAGRRIGAGVGLGWDQVAGVGRDAYPFVELFVHADQRWRSGLTASGALSLRRDLDDYNFALARWRSGSNGIDAHLAIGYDGPAWHLSAGPAVVGDNRGTDHFRLGLLPVGNIRLRIGHQDGWNVGVRLIDGEPSTAGGGSISLRVDLGPPASAGHRPRAGIYASAAESTAGLSISDELATTVLGHAVSAVRLSCLVGADLGHFLRAELTCAAEVIFF
ncbi:MAG: hypothetical protein ABJA82_04810 [Myxococcales bacterium]